MKIQTSHKKAFSMLTAIVVIVIMASIGAFVMNLSSKMVKSTTAQYQREQAMLYAKSYTEFAIMAVMSNDASTNCLENINGTAPGGYTIDTRISYIGDTRGGGRIASCAAARRLGTSPAATTPEPSLHIIVDVYVKYDDPDIPGAPITYHKRTLQKI